MTSTVTTEVAWKATEWNLIGGRKLNVWKQPHSDVSRSSEPNCLPDVTLAVLVFSAVGDKQRSVIAGDFVQFTQFVQFVLYELFSGVSAGSGSVYSELHRQHRQHHRRHYFIHGGWSTCVLLLPLLNWKCRVPFIAFQLITFQIVLLQRIAARCQP